MSYPGNDSSTAEQLDVLHALVGTHTFDIASPLQAFVDWHVAAKLPGFDTPAAAVHGVPAPHVLKYHRYCVAADAGDAHAPTNTTKPATHQAHHRAFISDETTDSRR